MKRLLVADDDRTVRESMRELFETAGFLVDTAENGREAWDKLKSSGADVVLTDGRMPDLDGWELLEACHAEPALERVPIFLISGDKDPNRRPATRWAYRVLHKPVDFDWLLSEVDRAPAA